MKVIFTRLLALYFLLGSLFPQTDFAQLLHLPEALHHFQQHLNEARSTETPFSIWTFIRDHY
ncbi:MAG: hypothetical protein OEQ53_21780, partial [Saprospiraceae bacterium]|nr:hypothetical protein [Saprospiraceae bacterium]